jgi:transposase
MEQTDWDDAKKVSVSPLYVGPWPVALLKRKPPKLAAVALVNKIARIAWKLMVSGDRYNAKALSPA